MMEDGVPMLIAGIALLAWGGQVLIFRGIPEKNTDGQTHIAA